MFLFRFAASSLVITLLLWAVLSPAQTPLAQPTDDEAAKAAASEQRLSDTIKRLADIEESMKKKRQSLEELKQKLQTGNQEIDEDEVKKQQEELRAQIAELNASFEQIAIGGIDLTVFSEEPGQEFDWRAELVQITQPILYNLKDLTEKPRQIEQLRADIERYEQQLEGIEKAEKAITALKQQELSTLLTEKMQTVEADWQQRRADTERALEVTRFKLDSLLGEDVSSVEKISEALHDFLRGRGLTLLLAVLAALAVWLLLSGLPALYRKILSRPIDKQRSNRIRLLLYSYRLFSTLFITLAVLIVFYIRGDLLLLTLLIFVVIVLGLGFKQMLPRYVAETRLLVGMGPVREGERVVYNGLPMQVEKLHMYTTLRNPDLEGTVRLPLSALDGLVSRPGAEEAWFPCRPGEYLRLPDGGFAQVVRQTLELVQLKMVGSVVQLPSADFLQLGARNLSREGFGVAVTFGIDYDHQKIALDRVPERFHEALTAAFEYTDLNADLEQLAVDFKEAGANSLDYLVYATMNGRAAGSYFKIGRLIQQTCVDVCNREGWGIPFAQLTVHQGGGDWGVFSTTNKNR